MEDTEVTTTTQTTDVATPEVDAGKSEEQKALEAGKDTEIIQNGQKLTDEKKDGTEDKKEGDKKEATPEDVEKDVKDELKAQEDIKADLHNKGVDFDALSQEYEENGKLSEESFKKLEEAGYPKSAVHAFIKGFEATVKDYTNAVYKLAGGEKEYARMAQFIVSLGQPEVDAFNQAIEAGNLTQLGAMMEGYKARMVSKYGTANRSVLGSGVSQQQSGFNSKDAMIKAMNDPRYGRDMTYTDKVQRMTMQSSFLR